jgi:hypothetical protein
MARRAPAWLDGCTLGAGCSVVKKAGKGWSRSGAPRLRLKTMTGHLGAVLTSGLAAVALALALLQAAVVTHGVEKREAATAVRTGPTNRYSAPGNRSGIPWVPADKAEQVKPLPESPEGRTPPRRQQEEPRSPPPPSRFRGSPPRLGPQPARKAAA